MEPETGQELDDGCDKLITGNTQLTGIIGYPLTHSLSPQMHNAAFKALGMDWAYVPFPVKPSGLEEAVRGLRALNVRGVNVTIPHKESVLEYIGEVDETASLIGAVNTLKFEDETIMGYNTDASGCLRALEEVTSVDGSSVIILGAGGAARACAFQLAVRGASVTILNRTPERARALAEDIKGALDIRVKYGGYELIPACVEGADILIDTTPVGMYPHMDDEPLVKAELMHEGLVVYDLVYNPPETCLLREARAAGAVPVSGLRMLLYQGAEAFRIWSGREPPLDVMEKALLDALQGV
ncbi:shikimate 5-dehydrogenase [Methanothermobacter marburgensis str. Marburg]|uniref:Shikimate dehydrogenase (NADP(+)) n=1 Tax=Methanothermobacter marburgensis (strain ATCC BAA-927 / DSM 2133 / JCM 14651 / NBRC 100331 / OCM 82 / Marburg) TaxID=79929 RepID=D9PVN9_METTM|nr:shikimate 5-dehydrogenase [Methanothermobacter marburgensis str. Marburg]